MEDLSPEYVLLVIIPAVLYLARVVTKNTRNKWDDKVVSVLSKALKVVTLGRAKIPNQEK